MISPRLTFALGMALAGSGAAFAQRPGAVTAPAGAMPSMTVAEIKEKIGLDRKDGATIALDANLRDDSGASVRFGDLIKRPTLLVPLFFRCPTACSLETDSLMKVLIKEETQNGLRRMAASDDPGLAGELARKRHMLVGRDLDVVFLSIHPKEGPDLAKARRALVGSAFEMGWERLPETDRREKIATMNTGFRFLTGTPEQVQRVTDSMGFRYFYNEPKDQMNHPAASVMLTPTGKIAAYFTGTEFATKLIASAVESAEKEEVAPLGRTEFFGCIMVDPITGARTILFNRIVMFGCFLTLGALGVFVLVMNRRYPNRVRVSDIVNAPTLPLGKGGEGTA